MRATLAVLLVVPSMAGCDPAITSRAEGGLAPRPPAVADGGLGEPIGRCTTGQRACNADQTAVESCVDGAWQPAQLCQPGKELCREGACGPCGSFQFSIETKQACSLSVLPGFRLDAESFITIGDQRHRVFGMTRWGKGHLVAWCDATTLSELLKAFPTAEYLGQRIAPRVASFGYRYLCQPGALSDIRLPASITYLGESIPEQYRGDPKSLARDWDVIIECGYGMSEPRDWAPLLVPFVTQEGKGLLAVMDYQSNFLTKDDFDRMNLVTASAGVQFNPLSLPWAPSSTEVVLDCVPDTVIK